MVEHFWKKEVDTIIFNKNKLEGKYTLKIYGKIIINKAEILNYFNEYFINSGNILNNIRNQENVIFETRVVNESIEYGVWTTTCNNSWPINLQTACVDSLVHNVCSIIFGWKYSIIQRYITKSRLNRLPQHFCFYIMSFLHFLLFVG